MALSTAMNEEDVEEIYQTILKYRRYLQGN
jgi:hypothetical protein